MITKESNKELAIVLCGHGSRNLNYLSEVVRIREALSKKLGLDIFECYIEINKPPIEECLDKVREIYKKVLIFPLLLFEGRHMLKDVNEKILSLIKNTNKEVVLINKLSLLNDIFPIILNIINNKYSEKFDILVTSCSFSKNRKVKKELEVYSHRLSFSLKISKTIFHFVGEEKSVFKELKKLGNNSAKILLHPVFFFNGYLYKKNIDTFSQFFTTENLSPLAHYDDIIESIFQKLIVKI
tara:strand:- start:151 stop:870 length:720 start_codon:yes stop_codon:yes gene_type:complete